MLSLARYPEPIATVCMARELKIAEIPSVTAYPQNGMEVQGARIGILAFDQPKIVAFWRAWNRWHVKCFGCALPRKDAMRLNDEVGEVVWMDNMGGGPQPSTKISEYGVRSWGVYTQEGLNKLVQMLRQVFGSVRSNEEIWRVDEIIEKLRYTTMRPLNYRRAFTQMSMEVYTVMTDEQIPFSWFVSADTRHRIPIIRVNHGSSYGYEFSGIIKPEHACIHTEEIRRLISLRRKRMFHPLHERSACTSTEIVTIFSNGEYGYFSSSPEWAMIAFSSEELNLDYYETNLNEWVSNFV